MKALNRRDRRTFLGVLAGLAASLGLGAKVATSSVSSQLETAFPWAQLPWDRFSASHIGREYLRLVPAEADASWLASVLSIGLPTDAMTDLAFLRNSLEFRQRADFDAGDVVNVDGWILSRTEARLCAISALLGA